MKALLISDRSEIIDFVTPLLKANGFDLIHYRWIIKALDNIEEIQPDIIVLSAAEYPRHWKTLAGFVQSGIGGNDVKMYLYDTEPLSKEDRDKSWDLGVLQFTEAFNKNKIESVPVELALNDINGRFRFYDAEYFSDKKYVKFHSEASTDYDNCFIKYVSMSDGNSISTFSADAKKEADSVCLYVKDYYEKEI